MSYCRSSSDDWRSDVYVYGTGGKWVTHVAVRRGRHNPADLPMAPPEPDASASDSVWDAYDRAVDRRDAVVLSLVQEAGYEPVPPPHGGQTYTDESPAACAERLRALRADGLHVPQKALDRLDREATPHPHR